jgi:hypothetical protein|nr:MAG TPA: hypothetical protein [Caudoviricetes sp.]
MKVYLFYLKLTKENEINFHIPRPQDNYVRRNDGVIEMLYGYTKSKELKNIFKESRDMNNFTIDKIDISYEDYVSLVNDYSNIGHYGPHQLKTKETVGGIYTLKLQDVYCTEFEYDECISLYPFSLYSNNKEYIYELLEVSKYFNHKYSKIVSDLIGNTYITSDSESYCLDEIAFDEVSIFARVFGITYRKDYATDENMEVL